MNKQNKLTFNLRKQIVNTNQTYGLEIKEAIVLSVEGPELITLVTELGNLPPVAEAVELLGQVDQAVGGDDGGQHELGHLVDRPAAAEGPVIIIRGLISNILHQSTSPIL